MAGDTTRRAAQFPIASHARWPGRARKANAALACRRARGGLGSERRGGERRRPRAWRDRGPSSDHVVRRRDRARMRSSGRPRARPRGTGHGERRQRGDDRRPQARPVHLRRRFLPRARCGHGRCRASRALPRGAGRGDRPRARGRQRDLPAARADRARVSRAGLEHHGHDAERSAGEVGDRAAAAAGDRARRGRAAAEAGCGGGSRVRRLRRLRARRAGRARAAEHRGEDGGIRDGDAARHPRRCARGVRERASARRAHRAARGARAGGDHRDRLGAHGADDAGHRGGDPRFLGAPRGIHPVARAHAADGAVRGPERIVALAASGLARDRGSRGRSPAAG